jgi:hypothetical protein
MKVLQLRNVLGYLEARHERHGSHECATALKVLGGIMQDFDDDTVAAFVKRATPRKKTTPRASTSRRRR